MELLKTPLYEKHVDNNAHIVDFSGWALPVEYSSILKEAKAVRSTCGLFDASHMGEIYVKGKDALTFLQSLTPNDISITKKGQLQYNLFLNDKGGIVDDLMIYNLGENNFLCVVNASNTDKVYNWLKTKKQESKYANLEIINESGSTSLLSLQGPRAVFVMEKIFGAGIKNLKYMRFTELSFKNKQIIISRSGYTGEDGFEIYCNNAFAPLVWDLILKYGKEEGLVLSGLGARDVLRIEAGYPLYGHEINDETNPLEASLGWVTKIKKDFIGKEKINNKRIMRKRVGFVMEERAIARQGYPILASGKIIGEVTSGTYSPNLNQFIGMAYIESAFSAVGHFVDIKIRDKFYKAKITNFNFIGKK